MLARIDEQSHSTDRSSTRANSVFKLAIVSGLRIVLLSLYHGTCIPTLVLTSIERLVDSTGWTSGQICRDRSLTGCSSVSGDWTSSGIDVRSLISLRRWPRAFGLVSHLRIMALAFRPSCLRALKAQSARSDRRKVTSLRTIHRPDARVYRAVKCS